MAIQIKITVEAKCDRCKFKATRTFDDAPSGIMGNISNECPKCKGTLRIYGTSYDPRVEDETRCVKSVSGKWGGSQCNFKRGHGKGGLYCSRHKDAANE